MSTTTTAAPTTTTMAAPTKPPAVQPDSSTMPPVIDITTAPRRSFSVNGHTYNTLFYEPESTPKLTVFLVHGWPDLSAGWRYIVPALLDQGCRVVCPDLIGFGSTDAPEDMASYAHKRVSADLAEIAKQIGVSQIILGGHDWGGWFVYRMALWQPQLVTHVFSVCTPFIPPTGQTYQPIQEFAALHPQFGYQIQLGGTEVDNEVVTSTDIRELLNAIYGGKSNDGEKIWDAHTGVNGKALPSVTPNPFLTPKEMDYYVQEYSKHGIHTTLNWYRSREENWEDERALTYPISFKQPILFIQANEDDVLTPDLAVDMPEYIPKLTKQSVNSSHWALWQTPNQVNGYVGQWLKDVVFPDYGITIANGSA